MLWRCVEQIKVPQELPGLVKAYCKEVIRYQPSDIVAFSRDYFAALADGRELMLSCRHVRFLTGWCSQDCQRSSPNKRRLVPGAWLVSGLCLPADPEQAQLEKPAADSLNGSQEMKAQ